MKNYQIEVEHYSYPDDFVAYFVYAEHADGTPYTDQELELASEDDNNQELLCEAAYESKIIEADFYEFN
jgi:hypothetical protein